MSESDQSGPAIEPDAADASIEPELVGDDEVEASDPTKVGSTADEDTA